VILVISLFHNKGMVLYRSQINIFWDKHSHKYFSFTLCNAKIDIKAVTQLFCVSEPRLFVKLSMLIIG